MFVLGLSFVRSRWILVWCFNSVRRSLSWTWASELLGSFKSLLVQILLPISRFFQLMILLLVLEVLLLSRWVRVVALSVVLLSRVVSLRFLGIKCEISCTKCFQNASLLWLRLAVEIFSWVGWDSALSNPWPWCQSPQIATISLVLRLVTIALRNVVFILRLPGSGLQQHILPIELLIVGWVSVTISHLRISPHILASLNPSTILVKLFTWFSRLMVGFVVEFPSVLLLIVWVSTSASQLCTLGLRLSWSLLIRVVVTTSFNLVAIISFLLLIPVSLVFLFISKSPFFISVLYVFFLIILFIVVCVGSIMPIWLLIVTPLVTSDWHWLLSHLFMNYIQVLANFLLGLHPWDVQLSRLSRFIRGGRYIRDFLLVRTSRGSGSWRICFLLPLLLDTWPNRSNRCLRVSAWRHSGLSFISLRCLVFDHRYNSVRFLYLRFDKTNWRNSVWRLAGMFITWVFGLFLLNDIDGWITVRTYWPNGLFAGCFGSSSLVISILNSLELGFLSFLLLCFI